MRIKVVGVESVNYFSKKRNRQVVGKSLHYVDLGTKRENLTGYKTGDVFISDGTQVSEVPVRVGAVYTMYMNGYDVDYLAEEDLTDE